MLNTPSSLRLGKRPARLDPRTVKLARFLPSELPAPPDATDWASGIVSWGMMRNDLLGDCTIAGLGHAVQVWSAATGNPFTVPDQVVVDYYGRWCGYIPGDPSTDNGGIELDVLNQWRKSSDGFFTEKLIGYADPDPGDLLHIKQSIWLFGLSYIGLSLPISAQRQDVWDVVDGASGSPGSWGGHCVIVLGYDNRTLTCVTWGELKQMTWAFWQKYCDESHTLLSKRWLDSAPSDYKFLGDLQAELDHF